MEDYAKSGLGFKTQAKIVTLEVLEPSPKDRGEQRRNKSSNTEPHRDPPEAKKESVWASYQGGTGLPAFAVGLTAECHAPNSNDHISG